MNKEQVEMDCVTKAVMATHRIRQPSWAAHCQALGANLDEAEEKAAAFQNRPTIKIQTPPYDFRPTPLAVVIPKLDEVELDWDT